MNFKIVADSSCDLLSLAGVDFASVPLKISTAEQEFVDNEQLDVAEMVEYLQHYKGRSFTSCPNAAEWEATFAQGDQIFVFPISSGISGSYQAAVSARESILAAHPEKKIHVFNTLTVSCENILLIERVLEEIRAGEDFDTICRKVEEYSRHTHLIFSLESLHNFAQNGRVSKVTAAAADMLGIRVMGVASEQGDLEVLAKLRGQAKAIAGIVAEMKKRGYAGGRVDIGDVSNPEAAALLGEAIRAEFAQAEVTFHHLRGLCSYYAQSGGLLIGFADGN